MMAVVASPIGERIRLRRQALGMTQDELAARVGVSASAVLGWEKDRYFPARHQGAVERVLNISLSEPEPEGRLDFDPADRDEATIASWTVYSVGERQQKINDLRLRRAAARKTA